MFMVVARLEACTVVVESGVVDMSVDMTEDVTVMVLLTAGIADVVSVPGLPPGGLGVGGEALPTETTIEGRGKSPRTTSDRLSAHAKKAVWKALMSKRS